MTQEVVHSHLGASGAYRWMNCGGSVELSKTMAEYDDYSVDPVYRAEGTAAHLLASRCVAERLDAWKLGQESFNGIMAIRLELECIQTYVDYCHRVTREGDTAFIEHPIGERFEDRPHPAFFGTVDFAVFNSERVHIVDFKYGAGISIAPEENKQCMYYAYGILRDIQKMNGEELPHDFVVRITIVQPRTFEKESIKTWDTTAGFIFEWAREQLLPKMRNPGTAYVAGEHCRFCPAKIACPLLKGMFSVAATINTDWIKKSDAAVLGQEWLNIAPVKMYIKAVQDETYNRHMAGVDVAGTKLVNQKANRVWKEGAGDVMLKSFGDLAMTPPELKSPAQVAELGPSATALVNEWAFVPQTGYTVASQDDKKPGIKMKTAEETFANFTKT